MRAAWAGMDLWPGGPPAAYFRFVTTSSEGEPFPWRTVQATVVVLVVAAFLFSLRTLLNPFLLFALLTLLVSPYAGSRPHLLLVGAAGGLTLIWLLQTTGFLLAPFLLALVLAYILHPAVRALRRRGVGPGLAIFLLVLPLLVLLAAGIGIGMPLLGGQIADFIARIPDLVRSSIAWAERMQSELARRDFPLLDEQVALQRLREIRPEVVTEYLQQRQSELARRAWAAVLGVGRGLGSVLTILGYVFLTPILTFYLLRDYDTITARLAGLLPETIRPATMRFFMEYDRLLSAYLRGQVLAAAAVGVLTAFGFWVLGFPYALLLGVIAGVFNVVPYMGLIASLVPAVIIALFSGSILSSLGIIVGVFAAVQLLDSSVIGPKIVGDATGLHPVWVILALAISGYFFGFVGLLIAVPLAVLVKLLLVAGLQRYTRSGLFRGGAAGLQVGEELSWPR